MLPFTHAQFLEVFAKYNLAVWPGQWVAYVLAAGMLAALWLPPSIGKDRFIGVGLAAMWLWTGIAYHWWQFTAINQAAWAFGALFVAQGLLFAQAAAKDQLRFAARGPGVAPWLGWALVVYAAILYPLLGLGLGPGYPQMPMFGITPCPVTLFMFGLLLLSTSRVSRWLLVVPLVWSLIGGSAAWILQVPQDWLLLVSGISVFWMARKSPQPVPASSRRTEHLAHKA